LNCERFEALLPDYLEGTLTQDLAAEMAEHAKTCEACAKAEEDMRLILTDLAAMDASVQVPAEWSQRWRQAVRDEEKTQMLKQEETHRRKPISWRARVSAAAAVLVLVAGSLTVRELIPRTAQEPGADYSQTLQKSEYDTYQAQPKLYAGGDAGSLPAPMPEAAADESAVSSLKSADTTAAPATGSTVNGVKVIRTASYSLATMQFEQDLNAIKALAASYQGWVEYAGVSGDLTRGDMRYANLTLRIPTESLEDFRTGVTQIGRVTDSSESATDVSESYSDTSMRLATQQTKMERLEALLGSSGELADILAVENEIANTQYQIDSYESDLRGMDSRIDYTKIDVYLTEETAKDAASEQNLSLGERIQKGFAASLEALGQFLQDAAVFLVIALPVILILALIALVIILIRKHHRRHTK
jgi:hypothetical protein